MKAVKGKGRSDDVLKNTLPACDVMSVAGLNACGPERLRPGGSLAAMDAGGGGGGVAVAIVK